MKIDVHGIGMTSRRTRERLVQRLREEGIKDERILGAIGSIPRHVFVDEALASRAYEDTALPIGHGQTISQPYIVALMTQVLLDGGRLKKVLEVGTGSGYQAAILAEIVKQVYTIEIVEALGRRAQARLQALGYRNIEVRIGDGYAGWPERAPFDGIIVTAAAPAIPQALVDQLKPGGRMVIPVGERWGAQDLLLVSKGADGRVERKSVLPVRFVPLVHGRPLAGDQ